MDASAQHTGDMATSKTEVDHSAHMTMDAGDQGHGAHDRHEGHSVAMFRDRFWLSLLLTIPVVIWSPDIQEWLGYQAPTFPGSDLIPRSSAPWCSCTAVSSSCAAVSRRSATAGPG